MASHSRKRKRQNDLAETPSPQPDAALVAFADLIAERAEVFASMGDGSEVAAQSLQIAKKLFDQGLAAESTFLSHATTLFAELVEQGIQTRAKSRRKERGSAKSKEDPLLEPTPLAELFIDGMPDEQVWEQLDMRAAKVGALVSRIVTGGDDTPVGIDAEEVEEMTVDEAEAAGLDEEDGSDDSEASDASEDEDDSDPDEFGLDVDDDDDDDEEEDDIEEPSDTEVSFTQLRDSEVLGRGKRLSLKDLDDDSAEVSVGPRGKGKRSEVDDDFFSLDAFLRESEQGEIEMRRMMSSVPTEDDDPADVDEDDIDLFAALDGTGGGLDSDDEEEADGMDLGDVADIGYEEFFGPPPPSLRQQGGKRKAAAPSTMRTKAAEPDDAEGDRRVRFSEQVKVKPIASRRSSGAGALLAAAQQKGVRGALEEIGIKELDDSEDSEDGNDHAVPVDGEEDSEASGSDAEDQEDEAIEGLRDDLFAEEDDDDQSDRDEEEGESRYERRVRALRKQIAELEAENVAAREWTMRGEAKSKERPMNSLLEEDLDFEQMAKVVPVVTTESTTSLEERIKKRILDDNFDDVVRRRPFDPAAYLPSRLLNIAGTQSDKSLAELYEEEYSAERQKAEGREVVHEVDARLAKEHGEVEKLYDDLCARLDALSNARFTPKAPQTAITVTTNQAAVALESALPTASSAATLLAPEEVFAPGSMGPDGAVKAELTPAERKAARQRTRRQRSAREKQLDTLSNGALVVGGGRARKAKGIKGDKVEKQAAVDALVGKRGVTVIGKPSAKVKAVKGKAVARAEVRMASHGSAALKL